MSARLFVIDRIERSGSTARIILLDDAGTSVEIAGTLLVIPVAEGAVLRVPVLGGVPVWGRARRDHLEEARRLRWAKAELERLRQKDPGGDLDL